jgi:hypothetical protein
MMATQFGKSSVAGDTPPKVGTMSAVNQTAESRISSKALELLDCFKSGFDDVIYATAELIAKRRGGSPVRIESGDVEKAAELFFHPLKESLVREQVGAEQLQQIERMLQCLKDKCQLRVSSQPR